MKGGTVRHGPNPHTSRRRRTIKRLKPESLRLFFGLYFREMPGAVKSTDYDCPVCRGRVPGRLPGRQKLCPDAVAPAGSRQSVVSSCSRRWRNREPSICQRCGRSATRPPQVLATPARSCGDYVAKSHHHQAARAGCSTMNWRIIDKAASGASDTTA